MAPVQVSEKRGSIYASYYKEAGKSMDIGDAARMDPQEARLAAVKQHIFRVLGRVSPEKQKELLEWLKQCEGPQGGPLRELAEPRLERVEKLLVEIEKMEARKAELVKELEAAQRLGDNAAATILLAATLATAGAALIAMGATGGIMLEAAKARGKAATEEIAQLDSAMNSMTGGYESESRVDTSTMGERAGRTLITGQSQANDVASLKDLIISFMSHNPFAR